MCIRYKVTTATAAGLSCLFRRDGPDSHQYLLEHRTREGGQSPEKGEKERDKSHPDAGCPPGKPYGKPQVLEGWGTDECLICIQVGHWTKECPNYGKPPKTACYKCHQLGHWEALCPGDPRVSCQVPSLPSHWESAPANPPATDNHHRAGAKDVTESGR